MSIQTSDIISTDWYQEILNYVTDAGYYAERQYLCVSANNQKQKIRKLALICQDELLYLRKDWANYKVRLTSRNHMTCPADEIIAILQLTHWLLRSDREYLDDQVLRHQQRVWTQTQDPKYLQWKADIWEIYQDHQYCFECGSTDRLECDHVLPHQSFKDKTLAYDRSNGQILCHQCNSRKGSVGTEDYRTTEHLDCLADWLENKVNKKSTTKG